MREMAPVNQTSNVFGEDLMETSVNAPQAAKSM
jgi:hypothetical protein